MKTATQVITRSGLMGPQTMLAPAGWEFDKATIEIWYWLIAETRRKDFKRQRDKFTCEAKIEVLGQVLSNILGMATTYWVLCARELKDKTA